MWSVKSICRIEWDGLGAPAGVGGICQVCMQESVSVVSDTWLNPFFSCTNSTSDNYEFLKGIKQLVQASGHKIKICYEYMNRGDRWMQVCTNDLFMSLICELILEKKSI